MPRWEPATIDAAAREREVRLTTWGRRTGSPHQVTIWIASDGERLFVRSGGGPGRDWTRNLLSNGRATLHIAGRDVPVRGRYVTDPAEARAVARIVRGKYGANVQVSDDDQPLTAAEQATFELLPEVATHTA